MNSKTRSFNNFQNQVSFAKTRTAILVSNKNFGFSSNLKDSNQKHRFGHELSSGMLSSGKRDIYCGAKNCFAIFCFALNSSNSYMKKDKNLSQNIGNQNFATQNSNNQKLQEKMGSAKNINKKVNSSKENLLAYSKVSEVKLITIGLASPLRIRQWAERTLPSGKRVGEVLNANTLHHKTFKPQKGGLFCERIFGPLKDFTCACGKVDKSLKKSCAAARSAASSHEAENKLNKKTEVNFLKENLLKLSTNLVSDKTNQKKIASKNLLTHYCPDCDVEYTWSVVRRYQLGYIKLNSPVTHVWYLKSTPSYLSILLDIKKRNLINTTYCSEILTIERSSKKILKLLDTESPNELFKKWQIIMNKKSTQQTTQGSLNNSQYNLGTSQKLGTKSGKVKFVKQNLNFLKLSKVVTSTQPGLEFGLDFSKKNSAFLTNKKQNIQTNSIAASKFLKNSVRKENYTLSQFAPLSRGYEFFKNNANQILKENFKLINKSSKKYNSLILFISLILIRLNFNRKINLVNNQLFDAKQKIAKQFFVSRPVFAKQNHELSFAKQNFGNLAFSKILKNTQNQKFNLLSSPKSEAQIFLVQKLLNVTNVNLLNNNFQLNNQNSKVNFLQENSSTKESFLNFYSSKNLKNLPISFYIVLKEEKILKKQLSLLTAIEKNWVSICQKAYFNAVFKINSIFSKNSVLSGYQNSSSTNNLGLISKENLKEILVNNIYLSEKFSLARVNFSKKLKSLFEIVKNSYKKHIKYILKNANKSNLYLKYITIGELNNQQKIELFINNILTNTNLENKLSVLTKKQNLIFTNLLTDMFVEQLLLSQYFVKKEDNLYSGLNQFGSLVISNPEQNSLNISKNKVSVNFLKKDLQENLLNLPSKIFYYSKLFLVNLTLKQENLDKLNNKLNSSFTGFKEKNNIFFTTSYNKISSAYLNLNLNFAALQKSKNLNLVKPELVSNFVLKEFGCSSSLLNFVNKKTSLVTLSKFSKNLNQNLDVPVNLFFPNLKNNYLYNKVLLLKNSLDFNKSLIGNSWNTVDNLALRHLTTVFDSYNLNNKLSKEQEKNPEFVPNLVNNCYSLSHRETWEGDKDWQIFAIYSSNLPSYTVFNSSETNLDFENLDLFSHDRTIPAYNYRFVNSGEQIFGEFNIMENSNSNSANLVTPPSGGLSKPHFRNKFTQETKTSANFSGPGIINLLLEEFSFSSLKKLDKQNRILLYQLNKYISFYKKNLKFCETKKKKTRILKLLRDFTKKRDFLIRRTKLVRKLFRKDTDPRSMILTLLPVLPPDLRPIVKMGSQIAASDLNRLYQRVIYRNDRLKKFLKDSSISNSYSMKYAQRLLQEAVDNLIQNGKSGVVSEKDSRGRLLKSLSDILKGKQGRFRQYLLGKRVDYSGRSVIVVGPKLKIHECGIPKEMALELYLPFLLKAILVRKKARTVIGAKTFIQTNPTFTWELLREIMQLTPVLLNRAPTLHRLGIQAFQPRLVEGRAILLHPLVCPAFNADFDGDQMAVHVPITVEARAEAWKLMLSRNNFLSPATGEPLAIPSQDMVLGCYYLTTYGNKWAIKHQRGSGFYFTNLMDVMKAYNQQRLDVHALVWVKWDLNNGQIESGTEREEPREIRISKFGNWQEIKPKTYNTYSSTNNLNSQYICTTPGRILFNMVLQKFI